VADPGGAYPVMVPSVLAIEFGPFGRRRIIVKDGTGVKMTEKGN